MKRLALGTLGAVLVLSTIAVGRAGGWAVVTVEKVSDYIVVGKPLVLTFSVRQHGKNPLGGLHPRIEARSGSKRIQGRAWELPNTGGYRASITVPEPGDWNITIESGFGRSGAKLLPWKAIDSTQTLPALSEPERGRQLFAAKGCVSCHVHRSVDIAGEVKDVGPDLSDRKFAADYLAKFLADPSIKPPTNNNRMPNLALRQQDIGSLVAFINSERKLSSR